MPLQLPTHMLHQGIHDIYHASLLNDDRRFPSRLYSQIVAETELKHEDEWAAEKIVSHAGSRTDSLFEVLWHPGDKTWMTYDQVQDLNLLQPYLEAQGVSNISELPAGTGNPPLDDPQTYIGAIHLPLYKNPLNIRLRPTTLNQHTFSPRSLQLPAPLDLTYSSASTMTFHPKNHYKPHPLLAACPDSLIQLTSIDPNLVIHPLQLQEYICYDNDVRCCNVTTNTYVPAGYTEFAAAYNASKSDNPCEFTTWDKNTSLYNVNNFPILPSLLEFPFFDTRYNDLHVFGLIKLNGDLDNFRWDMTHDTLLCPHHDAVRYRARADSRCEEKARKKHQYKEAYPQGFTVAGPSLLDTNQRTHKGHCTHRGKESASSSDSDANDNDEKMTKEPTVV
ncbi:hypothetical protein C0993_002932 [Termitomyces sp. T159_Od127]|nr:hypothetical protein C0993_002932 [Termitomyces sp. T159_Od127]